MLASTDLDNVQAPLAADIVLGDSPGAMAMYFAASDLVFIGGSLLPLGVYLIEASALGTPILIGPTHTISRSRRKMPLPRGPVCA
ncbi:hypothetical protein CTP10_R80170 (plasmid) [Cupriavidus sp. P-10]|nr:hypothetical protein CTP10_R80170 [Cupriavidus sp. P-10]